MLLLLIACTGESPKDDTGTTSDDTATASDMDGDGVPLPADCDDTDPYTYPGAHEVPYDGEDQDCDGEDVTDVDGDGYVGDGAGGDDCNDSNPEVHPDAEVVCYDLVDEDCTEGWSQYDCDGDGYEVGSGGDCDDEGSPDVYPGAPDEWYDGIDSNCDGLDDYDQDQDGEQTTDFEGGTDCDDLDATVNEAADEVWDGIDNDCAGDPDALTNRNLDTSWYGDGYLDESLFAYDIDPVGDVDGDGVLDVVISVLGYNKYAGRAYVVPFGEGLQVPTDTALGTIDGTYFFGSAVTHFEGTGTPQVVVAEAGESSVHVFDADVFTGAASLTTSDASSTLTDSSYYIGADLDPWMDGSGAPYVMISSYEVKSAGMEVLVVPESAFVGSIDSSAATWYWDGTGDAYDARVLSDLDGDGLDEIGIATSGFSGSTSVGIVTGADVASGASDATSATSSGYTGHVELMGASDLDGDGYEEFLVSDLEADGNGAAAGKVWVWSGTDAMEGGAADELAMATISGTTDDGSLHATDGGDLDGDGSADVFVCAPGDGASSIKGACGWFSASDLSAGGDHELGTSAPRFASVSYDDMFGWGAQLADADGDGDTDLWVSCTGDSGSLLVFLRR